MHTKRLDAMIPQNLLLPGIHIPQRDIHQLLDADLLIRLHPPKHILPLFHRQPGQERHRHAVDIPTPAGFRRVDVGVRIHPDDSHFAVQPLPDGFRGAGDGPDGDGVIAPEREDAAALLCVLVDLLAELLRDGADGERVLHVAVIGVGGGGDGGVGVDGVVVEEVIA